MEDVPGDLAVPGLSAALKTRPRGLARASDEGEKLARLDAEGDAVDGRRAVVSPREALDLDHECAAVSPRRRNQGRLHETSRSPAT